MDIVVMENELRRWLDVEHRWDYDLYLEPSKNQDSNSKECNYIIRVKIYTLSNEYTITASPDGMNGRGYMFCGGGSRTPRAGEPQFRGSDLADGVFSKETWYEILQDIVGYESVKIHQYHGWDWEKEEQLEAQRHSKCVIKDCSCGYGNEASGESGESGESCDLCRLVNYNIKKMIYERKPHELYEKIAPFVRVEILMGILEFRTYDDFFDAIGEKQNIDLRNKWLSK